MACRGVLRCWDRCWPPGGACASRYPPPSPNPKTGPNVDLRVSALTAQYIGVSLFCGSLVVIAAFVYNATRRPKAPDVPGTSGTEPQYEGFVATFLVASTITLWAVTGEPVLLLHIIQKVIDRRMLNGNTMIPIEMLVVFRCVVVLTLAVMAYYGWVSIRRTIEEQVIALQTREALRAMREEAARQPEERRLEAEQLVSDIAAALQPGASRQPGVGAVQRFRQRVLPHVEPDKREQASPGTGCGISTTVPETARWASTASLGHAPRMVTRCPSAAAQTAWRVSRRPGRPTRHCMQDRLPLGARGAASKRAAHGGTQSARKAASAACDHTLHTRRLVANAASRSDHVGSTRRRQETQERSSRTSSSF